MRFQGSIAMLFVLIFGNTVTAQSFEGVWKGTSLCQLKNSPCHDEVVVYHVSKDSTGKAYNAIANKIVNGSEEYMGTIGFTYDATQKSFISVDSVRNAKWEFKITGTTLKGTLVYNGDLYRTIDAKKEN